MAAIPYITDTETWLAKTTLKKPNSKESELQYADTDIHLSPSDREPTAYPMVPREVEGCSFAAFLVRRAPLSLPVFSLSLASNLGQG